MIAKQIISNSLVHLHPDDTVNQALTIMQINYVKHLPIVKDYKLLGLVSEEILLKAEENVAVSELTLGDSLIYAKGDDHLFDLIAKFAENKLTSLPVLDQGGNYLGLLSQEDILSHYAESFSMKEPGSILVLEVTKNSYTLSEIARIVELENASIICTFITEVGNNKSVLVTLKINRPEIESIIRAFDRYDYQIKATYTEEEVMENLKERYDSLMSFLNV